MKILDCTLRDGGYYTQWDFSEALTERYFIAMEQLPVDMVEIGYRNHPEPTYYGRHYYSPVSLLQKARRLMPSKKLVLMLNQKSCIADSTLNALLANCRGLVDMFRIATAPNRLMNALDLARHIKNEGFNVAVNIMYMSSLGSDSTVMNQLAAFEGVVDTISLVDSYGGVYPQQVTEIVTAAKKVTSVPLGFHGHNNLEMAFANSLAAVEAGCELIDATITGMGRGAGNLKTELLLTHLSSYHNYAVDYTALGGIVNDFEQLRELYKWGTNLPYMISGINSLPQQNVMDWISKRYHSIHSIVRALQNKKEGAEDNMKLPVFNPMQSMDKAFIIGGGASVKEHIQALLSFIDTQPDACIIHASSKNAALFSQVPNQQYYCLVGNEGHRLEEVFDAHGNWKGDCILPPYPRKMGTYIPVAAAHRAYELEGNNFSSLYADSHTSLAIQTAIALGVKQVYVVGYDGYVTQALTSQEQELTEENNFLFKKAAEHFQTFKSITATKYNIADQSSVYQYIA